MQVDMKLLDFEIEEGKKIRCFQYTAIDDATRIRTLKIYARHTQQNTIDFVNYVIVKLPFRIFTIQTDNGLLAESTDIYLKNIVGTCTVPSTET